MNAYLSRSILLVPLHGRLIERDVYQFDGLGREYALTWWSLVDDMTSALIFTRQI
jgi:hypothetical protein